MRNKLIYLFGIVFVLALLISACGGGGSDPTTNTNCVLGSSNIGECKI